MLTTDPDSWPYDSGFVEELCTKSREVALRLLVTADLGLRFTRALMTREFTTASEMLTPALKAECSAEQLRDHLEEMLGYAEAKTRWQANVRIAMVADSTDMADWEQPDTADFGWAYVGIYGADYIEAVVVMITREGERLAIRQIEWGRP